MSPAGPKMEREQHFLLRRDTARPSRMVPLSFISTSLRILRFVLVSCFLTPFADCMSRFHFHRFKPIEDLYELARDLKVRHLLHIPHSIHLFIHSLTLDLLVLTHTPTIFLFPLKMDGAHGIVRNQASVQSVIEYFKEEFKAFPSGYTHQSHSLTLTLSVKLTYSNTQTRTHTHTLLSCQRSTRLWIRLKLRGSSPFSCTQ